MAGFVNSKDDFYVNGFGIGAMETTNAIYDEQLYKYCTTDTVPSFIVALVDAIQPSEARSATCSRTIPRPGWTSSPSTTAEPTTTRWGNGETFS